MTREMQNGFLPHKTPQVPGCRDDFTGSATPFDDVTVVLISRLK